MTSLTEQAPIIHLLQPPKALKGQCPNNSLVHPDQLGNLHIINISRRRASNPLQHRIEIAIQPHQHRTRRWIHRHRISHRQAPQPSNPLPQVYQQNRVLSNIHSNNVQAGKSAYRRVGSPRVVEKSLCLR